MTDPYIIWPWKYKSTEEWGYQAWTLYLLSCYHVPLKKNLILVFHFALCVVKYKCNIELL